MRRRFLFALPAALLGVGILQADAIDPADQPLIGLGDARSPISWRGSLLEAAREAQRPYVSPFHGACAVEGCFRDSGSSHAQVHGLSARRFLLGVARIESRTVPNVLSPDLIAPAPVVPSALQGLLER